MSAREHEERDSRGRNTATRERTRVPSRTTRQACNEYATMHEVRIHFGTSGLKKKIIENLPLRKIVTLPAPPPYQFRTQIVFCLMHLI